ncbi:hypothetical protein EWE75_23985 [Sphingomonas populi]|uniref:Uncharacterized protein n=1 Tax=Sphingomonas populi TaxID=2484750 RepID=A0A4Q6XP08_9SPHN|nr:hypothetical protein [Sphingomonas populi]RZF59044.1 hypothetical protein EWE75_23985 [Sphingomonas populi]
MSNINGTNISAPVVPNSTLDSYPSHLSAYGKGGWKSAATVAERNAIPAARLEEGAIVYVVAERTPYIFVGGAWVEWVSGDALAAQIQEALDEQSIMWAANFINLEAAVVKRWNEDWGKTAK